MCVGALKKLAVMHGLKSNIRIRLWLLWSDHVKNVFCKMQKRNQWVFWRWGSIYLLHFNQHVTSCSRCHIKRLRRSWYSLNPVWMTFQSEVNTRHSFMPWLAILTSSRTQASTWLYRKVSSRQDKERCVDLQTMKIYVTTPCFLYHLHLYPHSLKNDPYQTQMYARDERILVSVFQNCYRQGVYSEVYRRNRAPWWIADSSTTCLLSRSRANTARPSSSPNLSSFTRLQYSHPT